MQEHGFYLKTPQTVQSLLNSELMEHFSASRLISHKILILLPPNLHLKHHNILNSATLQSLPEEGKLHDCKVITPYFVTPCPNL